MGKDLKTDEILSFATTWMGPESVVLRDTRPTEEGKRPMMSLTRDTKSNKQTNKQTPRHGQQKAGDRRGRG